MNINKSTHTIRHPVVSTNGTPTQVLVPIDEYLPVFNRPDAPPPGYTFVPNDVGTKVTEGASPLRAWREYLKLTQEEVAARMGVSRPASTQMEQSENPHAATLEKAAQAFGIATAQLAELYDEADAEE